MSHLQKLAWSIIFSGLVAQATVADPPKMPDVVPSSGQLPAVQGIASLTVSGGDYWGQEQFESGDQPYLSALDDSGAPLPDGLYRYELRMIKSSLPPSGEASNNQVLGLPKELGPQAQVTQGKFEIIDGRMVLR